MEMFANSSLRFSSIFSRFCETTRLCLQLEGGDEIDSYVTAQEHIDLVVLLESALESAPQFLLQLHVMMSKEEPVGRILILSLTVSYLSLAWTFTMADEMLYEDIFNRRGDNLTLARRVGFFVSQLIHLGFRLVLILFFTQHYKWWVLVVLLFHVFVIVTAENIFLCLKDNCELDASMVFMSFLLCFLHWLRDYLPLQHTVDDQKTLLTKMQFLSNVLFILENTGMFWALMGFSEFNVPAALSSFYFLALINLLRFYMFGCVGDSTRG